MTKTCNTCRRLWPLDGFHRDPRNADGRAVRCKECVYALRAARRAVETPEQRQQRVARQRVYTARSRALHGPDKPRPYGPGRREKDPLKTRARARLRWALDHGMPRPSACTGCGREVPLHGHHHHGYEAEHWLDVVWLCSPCHAAVHRDVA